MLPPGVYSGQVGGVVTSVSVIVMLSAKAQKVMFMNQKKAMLSL